MPFKAALFSMADLRKLFDLATQVRFLESSALSANSFTVLEEPLYQFQVPFLFLKHIDFTHFCLSFKQFFLGHLTLLLFQIEKILLSSSSRRNKKLLSDLYIVKACQGMNNPLCNERSFWQVLKCHFFVYRKPSINCGLTMRHKQQ